MSQRVSYPGAVTPQLMTAFAQSMQDRSLAVDTINERLCKVRAIYKIAVGKHELATNPATATLGFRESSARKRRKRRLPFDTNDLNRLFGHATGDGEVTDGYGSGLPFAVVVRYFARVKFPSIPAPPWQPRMGVIRREGATLRLQREGVQQ